MRRVLVTGASGFVGRHCLQPLRMREYDVHAVFSSGPNPCVGDVRWYRADLLDPTTIRALLDEVRPTHLLHLAWHPGWNGPSLAWLQCGVELLRHFVYLGGDRLVVSGTCAEYDWRYGYCSESHTPTTPSTLYGTCKNALQEVVTKFSRDVGLSSSWGRVFFVYGPYEPRHRLVPSVIGALLANEQAQCSHGGQIRDYLHVQDAADALVALLDSDVRGPVNIASGIPVVLRDLIYGVADRLERAHLVNLGALPTPSDEAPLVVGDVDLLHRSVGWQHRISLDEGIEMTLRWWQEHEDSPSVGSTNLRRQR